MFTHFTSDQHYGHAAVIEFCNRPFANVDEMDAALEKNYCASVGDDAFVLWVGDVSFHDTLWTKALLKRLPGRKALVRGNHDRSITHCLSLGFEFVADFLHLSLAGHKVTVSHYPPAGATKDLRYPERRPPHPGAGQYILHGHTHEKEVWMGKRRIHVGVDATGFKPIATEEILQLIQR